MRTKYMWIIRSFVIALFVTLLFAILTGLETGMFIQYKDPEIAAQIDFDSMSSKQHEAWHHENTIKTTGWSYLKTIFSDWFLLKYWIIGQWRILLTCFICCVLTHKIINKNVS